ncbi:MAG TPA: toll/interleukin-1 receptor domain-containing protein [Propionibacteriaceae bacterium]|nr:toll/interleukin-1 receptor domain-containing protein [Propionibacteriaceae bacterium]
MVESAAGSTGRIFISYRREETAYPAGWLFDRLADHFGAGQIFKDVDSIELGDDFVEMITRAVGSCDVLLALIGDQWLTVIDKQGRRRLDDPNDFVRLEIEAALQRKVRIIPILVEGATMPHADELPAAIAGLARRQALELSPSRFEYDTSRLLSVLASTLADVRTAQDDAAAISTPPANIPDQRIDAQQSGQQAEQATHRRAPSSTPAARATPVADRPSPDQTEPEDRVSKGLSRSEIVVLVLGGVVIVALIVSRLFSEPAQTGTDATTPSSPIGQVVFQDDFASRTNGWDDAGTTRAGGHYTNEAYRLFVEPTGKGSTEASPPRSAGSVYPSAPSNLRIEVDAKAFTVPDGTAYGVACRVSRDESSGYLFMVANDYVVISKYGIDGNYTQLSDDTGLPLPSGFKVNGTNRLEADCKGGEGDEAVGLAFRVNGEVAAEATDSKDPLTAGTVALVAETYEDAKEAVEVEFDNFVVQA